MFGRRDEPKNPRMDCLQIIKPGEVLCRKCRAYRADVGHPDHRQPEK